ncbi:subtilisin-like protease SBT3 [Corylus avellana]|uniref:subtilisin-like protease SBT3 n=1 Tax=Corylus avellana TaxID=13451 RepID=UPI00286A0B6C|nr:subtilisin-like protease SBT3 [Corylus avellana]
MDKSLMPKAFNSHQNWYSSTIDSLKFTNQPSLTRNPSSPSLVYIYGNALHGFSIVLSVDELEALKKSRGFISAYPDSTMMFDTTHTPEFLSLNLASDLLHASNYGQDAIIGVIDSGVWPESPSFKDGDITTKAPTKWKGSCKGGQDFNSSMCNKKLIGARYFNAGLKAELKDSFHSVDSARDFLGHGTTVSTIAAGNYVEGASFFGYAEGTAKGVAPHARVAIYKVSWLEGIRAFDVIAGLEQAIVDGVDVICFCLTFPERRNLYEDPLAIASFAAMEKGIVVSTAAGNSGPHYKSVMNDIPWVLTVSTAGTIDRQIGGTLIVGDGLKISGWSMFSGTMLQNMTLLYSKTLSTCTSTILLSKALDGIVICDIGNIYEQIRAIVSTNLSAVILTSQHPDILDLLKVSYPYMVIGPDEGQFVVKYGKKC